MASKLMCDDIVTTAGIMTRQQFEQWKDNKKPQPPKDPDVHSDYHCPFISGLAGCNATCAWYHKKGCAAVDGERLQGIEGKRCPISKSGTCNQRCIFYQDGCSIAERIYNGK